MCQLLFTLQIFIYIYFRNNIKWRAVQLCRRHKYCETAQCWVKEREQDHLKKPWALKNINVGHRAGFSKEVNIVRQHNAMRVLRKEQDNLHLKASVRKMSMSDRLPFSEQGQLLFLGRLARQHKVSQNCTFLQTNMCLSPAGTELWGSGAEPGGFWGKDRGVGQRPAGCCP